MQKFFKKPIQLSEGSYKTFLNWVSVLTTIIVFIVFVLTFRTGIVRSGSMYPLLDRGSLVLSFRTDDISYGDVVTFYHDNEVWVKRLIGDEGDLIAVHDGQVYRNGEALEEPYINEAPMYEMDPVVVPKNCVFLMGDNRNNSKDSHIIGSVTKSSVIGPVIFYLK